MFTAERQSDRREKGSFPWRNLRIQQEAKGGKREFWETGVEEGPQGEAGETGCFANTGGSNKLMERRRLEIYLKECDVHHGAERHALQVRQVRGVRQVWGDK
ncbi:hypothetical protein CesoFtcFv8_015695 [Champsocephalus esox]|uniref:Uncharacterized protein n=1 Tax=Champsocephalus esox TaxID=159716 RepID=A0AAN8GT51_9TELE|nr:hypothetical protein CesoFtcFv8_015695 [Champsocephalus esox]